jgi:hypothetical protein
MDLTPFNADVVLSTREMSSSRGVGGINPSFTSFLMTGHRVHTIVLPAEPSAPHLPLILSSLLNCAGGVWNGALVRVFICMPGAKSVMSILNVHGEWY